jgi:hypothetical protein
LKGLLLQELTGKIQWNPKAQIRMELAEYQGGIYRTARPRFKPVIRRLTADKEGHDVQRDAVTRTARRIQEGAGRSTTGGQIVI